MMAPLPDDFFPPRVPQRARSQDTLEWLRTWRRAADALFDPLLVNPYETTAANVALVMTAIHTAERAGVVFEAGYKDALADYIDGLDLDDDAWAAVPPHLYRYADYDPKAHTFVVVSP